MARSDRRIEGELMKGALPAARSIQSTFFIPLLLETA